MLDLLGDVGGLYEAIKIICFSIIYFTNFMSFENYMVSELFKKDLDSEQKIEKKQKNGDKTKTQSREDNSSPNVSPEAAQSE